MNVPLKMEVKVIGKAMHIPILSMQELPNKIHH
jgi:hypothetical protein